MRAFLSHASADKAFVSAVAKELGRQFCAFDQNEFDTGEDFRSSIRRALDSSGVFVLFASKTSRDRKWVNFEIDEAELRKIRGSLKRVLVLIIDDVATISDLPEWLQRGRVRKNKSAKSCAREIDYHIQELIREQQQPPFVGRSSEISEAERQLIPVDGSRPPRILLTFGLPGMGRRTLTARISRDFLRLNKLVIVPIELGDGLSEFSIKVFEQVGPFGSIDNIRKRATELESEDQTQLLSEIAENLRLLVRNGEMPVLHDFGGLVASDGDIPPEFMNLFRLIDADGEIYLALVATRRPPLLPAATALNIPPLRVSELKPEEVRRLLSAIATQRSIDLSAPQISALAEYVRGYPPAAFYALELVHRYGIDAALNNQRRLVEFRTSFFLTSLGHSELEDFQRKKAMSILAFYGPLPLAVLGHALGLDKDELNTAFEYLYDCAFVTPTEEGYQALAEPLVDGVLRAFGGMVEINHDKVADALEDYLEDLDDDEKRLWLSRALFRALTLSGRKESDNSFSLTTDIVRLTEDFYHNRDYENAVRYGRIAVERRPGNVDIRSFYVRALVQNEDYAIAEAEIAEIRRLGNLREAYFLTGFMERRRDHLPEAITAYKEAVLRGRSGVSINRELADCYFRVGDLPNARKHIDLAENRDPDNRYIVDLQIQIASSQRDEETARSRLRILEEVDREDFYLHRLSVVEHAFGRIEQAYKAAADAAKATDHPTFAMLSQLIKCEIETGRSSDAGEHLNILERRFRRVKHDIKTGLRCKWEIARGEFDNALALWSQLRDKAKPVHLFLRLDILKGMLEKVEMRDISRISELQAEINKLHEQLSTISPEQLDIPIYDDTGYERS